MQNTISKTNVAFFFFFFAGLHHDVAVQRITSLLPQIDADDVITRDEQIYVLIGAHAKCERNIKAQIALVKGKCAAIRSI